MSTTPTSLLTLYTNVPLDPNYNFTLDFDSAQAQDTYFTSKASQVLEEDSDYSYIRTTEELKVQAYIDDLNSVNYLSFYNKSKKYYAFILNKRYISETCTGITFKIDVFQTFMFDYTFKESFIDREHQDRYNEQLKPIFNITPENLDCGNEYDIINSEKIKDNSSAPNKLVWLEVIASQEVAKGSYSSTNPSTFKNMCLPLRQKNSKTNLYVYLFPYILGTSQLISNFYTYDGTGAIVRVNNLMDSATLIMTSTAILSVRILHYSPIKYNIEPYQEGYLISFDDGYQHPSLNVDLTNMRVVERNNTNFGGVNLSLDGGFVFNLEEITPNNENLKIAELSSMISTPTLSISNLKNKNYETKLYTYPYQFRQICDYQSAPFTIKNENFQENKHICYRQSHGIQTKSKYFVEDYNNDNGKEYNTINSTISELPLINDAYISYIAQNKASATTGVALNIAGTVATLGLGIATGGVGLAVAGATALSLATQVGNQMIKIQDLKNEPDSIRQAGNNAEFDLLDENYQIVLTSFKIKEEFYDKIFNYLYHYGYKCNNFKIPNLRSRYYFNYIKSIGANIETNIDADYKNELVNIFDNGITIWHYRDSTTFKGVNNYEYENVEMNLIGD